MKIKNIWVATTIQKCLEHSTHPVDASRPLTKKHPHNSGLVGPTNFDKPPRMPVRHKWVGLIIGIPEPKNWFIIQVVNGILGGGFVPKYISLYLTKNSHFMCYIVIMYDSMEFSSSYNLFTLFIRMIVHLKHSPCFFGGWFLWSESHQPRSLGHFGSVFISLQLGSKNPLTKSLPKKNWAVYIYASKQKQPMKQLKQYKSPKNNWPTSQLSSITPTNPMYAKDFIVRMLENMMLAYDWLILFFGSKSTPGVSTWQPTLPKDDILLGWGPQPDPLEEDEILKAPHWLVPVEQLANHPPEN